jgi:hypothetical protein
MLSPLFTMAQDTDSSSIKMVRNSADTARIIVPRHSPKKASILSAVFPGAGQIYNKKYWKLPIIYGGIAALIYSLNFYQTEYDRFRQALIDSRDSVTGYRPRDSELRNVPQEVLYNIRESYRESRDLSAIGIIGLYAINIIDAAVDAHLKGFDVNENLSLRVAPDMRMTSFNTAYAGLSITLSFK